MTTTAPGINARIASQVRALRADRELTLDELAFQSSVSRSMISLIERGESSATAVVLDKIATGLGVPLAALFDDVPPLRAAGPLSRRGEQALWRDPESGYLRRNVSPPAFATPFQIVEVEFPPGARVGYETAERDVLIQQHVWLLEGSLELTVGDETHMLETGDCLAMTLDRPIVFRNPTRLPARYAVVIGTESSEAAA